MPPCDNKFVCWTYLADKILQQVIDEQVIENNYKDRQQPKIQ